MRPPASAVADPYPALLEVDIFPASGAGSFPTSAFRLGSFLAFLDFHIRIATRFSFGWLGSGRESRRVVLSWPPGECFEFFSKRK